MNWQMRWFKLRYWLCKFFGRNYKATVCGHKTKLIGKGKVFGQEYISVRKIPFEYCCGCLEKMAIRCAWCGNPILTGDPVTLYTPLKDFVIPDYAIVYKEDPLQLVGCLGWKCADTGADRTGFWVVPGKVRRVPSPMELVVATEGRLGFSMDVTDPDITKTVAFKMPEDER